MRTAADAYLICQAPMGPCGPGPCGPGPCGPPWTLMGQALMGPPGIHNITLNLYTYIKYMLYIYTICDICSIIYKTYSCT